MLEVAKIRRAVKVSPQSSKTSQANARRRWMLLSLGILIGFGICKPAARAQTYDGPAELPLTTVASAMADTPAPGSIISVNASGDLQGAINRAHCGDIVELQAGNLSCRLRIATTSTGSSSGRALRTACYRRKGNGPHRVMQEWQLWWGVRSIPATTRRT